MVNQTLEKLLINLQTINPLITREVFYNTYENIDNLYKSFYIKKSNGKKRLIEEPNIELKTIQQSILFLLKKFDNDNKNILISAFSFGIVGGENKSAVANGLSHLENKPKIVWKIDLKDFFHQITRDLHYQREKEIIIDIINTEYIGNKKEYIELLDLVEGIEKFIFYKNKLPMGAPTSSFISSFLFHPLDEHIGYIAKNYNIKYTRYIDDLVFSGESIGEEFKKSVREFINSFHLKINSQKTKTLKKNKDKQIITGISVSSKLGIDRTFKRNLRAAINNLCKEKKEINEEIKGKLNYIKQVSKKDYDRLIQYYNNKLTKYGLCEKI